MFQMKVQIKPRVGVGPKETKISNLPDKIFSIMVIRMLAKYDRRIEEYSENINKELENTKKKKRENQSEMKNRITEVKKIY